MENKNWKDSVIKILFGEKKKIRQNWEKETYGA